MGDKQDKKPAPKENPYPVNPDGKVSITKSADKKGKKNMDLQN